MDKSLMLKQIKEHLGIKKELDFADYLGIKQSTLATWHNRNTFDAELIISKCDFLDANWLLTGEGNMLKESNRNNESLITINRDSRELLEEKERLIQILLKQNENLVNKDIVQLQSNIEKLETQLKSLMEVIDMDKEKIESLIKEKTSR